MEKAVYGDKTPIAALASPPGEGALAVIRTSGSIENLAEVFSRPKELLSASGNTVIHGWLLEPNVQASQEKNLPGKNPHKKSSRKKIDEVLLSVYRAPKTYTGEDGVDISCHGGIATVKAVMAVLKKAGFREALPGEFSFRAFMNGKLDLTRAESVMELVSSKTGKGMDLALRRLSGILEKEISSIKALLMEVLAGTEIYLDYTEDEFSGSNNDEEAGRLPQKELALEAQRRLKHLAELWQRERIYSEGALVVLAGRPNAGKSSLFNYLLREDRSIVTDTPGTTRDWIEAQISIEEIPVRLADTAGIRETSSLGEAEKIGIERSRELIENANLVLYIIDGVDGITSEDRNFVSNYINSFAQGKIILLWNKADIEPLPLTLPDDPAYPILAVSAKTGEGIGELCRITAELLGGGAVQSERMDDGLTVSIKESGFINSPGPGSLRQKELIDSALTAIEEALALSESGEPLDLIAPLFRSAVNSLGEITGEVYHDDILELMFSRFCVGK